MKVIYRGHGYLIVARPDGYVWLRRANVKGPRVFRRQPLSSIPFDLTQFDLPLTAEQKIYLFASEDANRLGLCARSDIAAQGDPK